MSNQFNFQDPYFCCLTEAELKQQQIIHEIKKEKELDIK